MTQQINGRRAGVWTFINVLVVLYALFPVLWILSLSLKPTSTVKDGKLIPSEITFDNYKGIFSGDVFSSALINSIGIGLITTVVAVVIGGMAAYAVARLGFPGKRLLIGAALLLVLAVKPLLPATAGPANSGATVMVAGLMAVAIFTSLRWRTGTSSSHTVCQMPVVRV